VILLSVIRAINIERRKKGYPAPPARGASPQRWNAILMRKTGQKQEGQEVEKGRRVQYEVITLEG
jgi:hypothetical protein